MGVQYTGMDFGRFGLAAAPSGDCPARLHGRPGPGLPQRRARPAGRLDRRRRLAAIGQTK